MTFEQLFPLLTGSGGAIVVLILWVKSLRADKKTLEDASKEKDAAIERLHATIERLHNENKTLAMEYATNATKIISTLQELKPCQYKPQAN